jgi:antirestriction protein
MLKGYITNLGKYNEGELVGKWIDFPIDEDDLNEVFYEIGMNYTDGDGQYINRGYEEYFFTDWDCDFSHNFGEYESVLKINEIAEKLQDWDEDTFKAACEIWDINEVLDHDQSDYVLYYDVNNDYDLGYYWAVESGCYDLEKMGNLANYIDYEAFGRDINLETDGGFTSYGWIERC